MKKILLLSLLIFASFTNSLAASSVEMSKQEMMRADTPSTELVSPPKTDSQRSTLAIVLAVALIMIIVGLLRTFITKYALSMSNKNDSIYEKTDKDSE